MTVLSLTKTHKKMLSDFFIKLKKDTYYFWNRLGELYNKKEADRAAETMVNIPETQEKGFIYFEDDVIKGYCYLRFFFGKKNKRFTTSLGIVVADEYQGQSIGKKMMNYLIEFSRKNGYKKIWLATYTDNIKALKLYVSLGFEIEGIFMYDEYFEDIPRHVVSMSKFLDKECANSLVERNELINKILNS